MRGWASQYLRCPRCKGTLETTCFESDQKGDVRSGTLVCRGTTCHSWFPVIRGIPRLLEERLRSEVTREFLNKYPAAPGLEPPKATSDEADGLLSLKRHTVRNFGYEWTKYDRFGWDDPVYNLQREESVFREKSLLEPRDLKGKLVLDAGCGNGRYAHWAAQYGGRVIGIDLGDGVESASKNIAHLAEVQIVQADIFNLPFPDSCFDVIFAIGVLMHTGDAKAAARSLTAKLKPGGTLSVALYGKGNAIYEWVDRKIRQRTTRMSVQKLEDFTRRAYAVRRALERLGLAKQSGRFVRLDPHPHCLFDWYAAPIATHHSHAEVAQWFNHLGLSIIRSNNGNPRSRSTLRKWLRPFLGSPEDVVLRGGTCK